MSDYTLTAETPGKVIARDHRGQPFMTLRHHGQPWGPDVRHAAGRFIGNYFKDKPGTFSLFHPDYPVACAELQMLGHLLIPAAWTPGDSTHA